MTLEPNAQFLGGSDEIGSLGLLLNCNSHKLLLDYGITPSKPPTYPHPSPPVDLAFLTHSHLDHSGMMPWLVATHNIPVHATPLTKEVCMLLHKDTVKIAKMEGYASPYTNQEVDDSAHNYRDIHMNMPYPISEDLELYTHNAGHVPGSLMYEIKSDKSILFTGDFNVIDSQLIHGARPVSCDILFMESTYAGREHPKRDELEKSFRDRIEEIVNCGGQVIVPAFAVARSQELIMVLRKAGFNIWYDGMGRKISRIYLGHKNELKDSEALKRALNNIDYVYSQNGRKTASEKADVIISSSGMLDGGPVLSYINKIKHDKKSAILLTGYQIEGTNSRMLVEHGKINMYGVNEDIHCQVDYFDFSGHAGHQELIEFAKGCGPETIVLFHGDQRETLVEPLKDITDDVRVPSDNEPLHL